MLLRLKLVVVSSGTKCLSIASGVILSAVLLTKTTAMITITRSQPTLKPWSVLKAFQVRKLLWLWFSNENT